ANEIVGNALAVTFEFSKQLNGSVGGGDLDWTVPREWMVGGHVSGNGHLATFGKAGPVYVSTNWEASEGEKEAIERALNSTNIGWVAGTSASPRWMAVVTGMTWTVAVLAMIVGVVLCCFVVACLKDVYYRGCCGRHGGSDVEVGVTTTKPKAVKDNLPLYKK
ncbi:hypothetical protein HDU93_000460, partial [Gonapodya sp. JEL0774]